MQGFGDAEVSLAGSFSRLSYIVGNVQQTTNEFVHLNGQSLPLLYGGQSAFTSHYVNWDTVTWTFDDPNNPLLKNFANPLTEGAASAQTQIVPGPTNNGCTSLAAVVVSTTVKSHSHDGLLDSWKNNQGYCDPSVNEGSCGGPGDPAWVSLADPADPPKTTQQDVFVQLDYMCSKITGPDSCDSSPAPVTQFSITGGAITVTAINSFSVGDNVLLQIQNPLFDYLAGVYLAVSTRSSTQFTATFNHADVPLTPVPVGTGTVSHYSFDPRLTKDPNHPANSAIDSVVAAYKAHGVHLHINPTLGIHAIPEPTCTDSSTDSYCFGISTIGPPHLAPFPNQPGVVGWKDLCWFSKNQLVDSNEPLNLTDCGTSGMPPQAGEDCIPRFNPAQKDSYHYALWAHTLAIPNWNLFDGSLASAGQSSTTVTFNTSTANGLIVDSTKPNGRVTVAYSISNPNLNGTYLVHSVNGNSFTIQVPPAAAGQLHLHGNHRPGLCYFLRQCARGRNRFRILRHRWRGLPHDPGFLGGGRFILAGESRHVNA